MSSHDNIDMHADVSVGYRDLYNTNNRTPFISIDLCAQLSVGWIQVPLKYRCQVMLSLVYVQTCLLGTGTTVGPLSGHLLYLLICIQSCLFDAGTTVEPLSGHLLYLLICIHSCLFDTGTTVVPLSGHLLYLLICNQSCLLDRCTTVVPLSGHLLYLLICIQSCLLDRGTTVVPIIGHLLYLLICNQIWLLTLGPHIYTDLRINPGPPYLVCDRVKKQQDGCTDSLTVTEDSWGYYYTKSAE